MSFSNKHIASKINVDSSIMNYKFFNDHGIKDWTFKHFFKTFSNHQDISMKEIKKLLVNYKNSLHSILNKQTELNDELKTYINELIAENFTNEKLKKMIEDLNQTKINIVNSIIENVVSAEGSASVIISNEKGKRKVEDINDDFESTITIKKNKKVYKLIKPAASHTTTFNSPIIEKKEAEKINKLAYFKLTNECICESKELEETYNNNINDQRANRCFLKFPVAFSFLKETLDKKKDEFLFSLWVKIDDCTEAEEQQIVSLIRYILTDYMANCQKQYLVIGLNNERTPFVEYVVPIFKYFDAVFNNVLFQWCEKGLNSNKFITFYKNDDQGCKRFADGVGYISNGQTESMLIESSSDNNNGHSMEDTIKLLECTIRTLKLAMSEYGYASIETFKKYKIYSCLYSTDKLTLMCTSLADKDNWGYVFVRDANIPRTWEDRFSWVKVLELLLCLKSNLEEQAIILEQLKKENNGLIEVQVGSLINDIVNN